MCSNCRILIPHILHVQLHAHLIVAASPTCFSWCDLEGIHVESVLAIYDVQNCYHMQLTHRCTYNNNTIYYNNTM